MGAFREPLPDDTYLMLMGFFPDVKIGWNHLISVPASGWSRQNPHFDGIKYSGQLSQNPYNPFNVGKENFFPKEAKEVSLFAWKPDYALTNWQRPSPPVDLLRLKKEEEKRLKEEAD